MQDTSASAQRDIYLEQSIKRHQNTQQVPIYRIHRQAATIVTKEQARGQTRKPEH